MKQWRLADVRGDGKRLGFTANGSTWGDAMLGDKGLGLGV